MLALAFLASVTLALSLGPLLLRALDALGWTVTNYRGARLLCPSGLLIPLAGAPLLALIVLAALAGAPKVPADLVTATIFVTAVAALGLADDLLGHRGGAPRGLRGHARALARARPSTGALKALGTAALAIAVLAGRDLDPPELLLGAAVLTLCAHVSNLLDLRPGRSIKAMLVLGVGVSAVTASLEPFGSVAAFLAPILVLLVYDLRERAMLGDTGAGAVGAVAGLAIVLSLGSVGQAVALAGLLAVTAYGELRSISALVDRSPPLRRIDSAGSLHA